MKSLARFSAPLLALLAGVVVVLPAIVFGMPNNNDLANHYHFAVPFYEALRQGDVYPGWLATPNFGYGDVVVRFYPPALYYLLAAGRAITGNWYTASLLVVTCLSAVGSFAAYFWARSYLSPNLAVWASVFYALMPYHLAEFYQAAQLAEFAAGAALLFALAFTKRICDGRRWDDVAGLAASYAALVLTHLPLALFGSLTLLVYALMSAQAASKSSTIPLPKGGAKSRALIRLTTAVFLGLAATAFYWVTMIAEMKWIVADGTSPDPLLDYRRNFVFSTLSPEKHETLWWMGLLALATIAMCIPAIAGLIKKRLPVQREKLVPLTVLLAGSLLMTTIVSKPIWAVIPYLDKTQHPFRWLAVTSTVAPLLMAATVPFWSAQFRQRKRSLTLAMTGMVLIAVTFSLSQTVRGATYLSRNAFEQMLAPLREAPGIVQWLPIWASAAAHDRPSYQKCTPPPTALKVDATGRTVQVSEWSNEKRKFTIEAGTATEARVATFYYPHWIARANGKPLTTRPAVDGTLLISIPAEQVAVDLEFREPLRTKLSSVTSIIGWTLITFVLIFGAKKRRDHEPTAI